MNPSWTSPTFHTASTNLPSPTNLRASVLESSMQIAPLFGHLAPVHDFVGYNRSRANSNVQEWQYPRSSLVYLRELGEGQFGKVLLMKTQVCRTSLTATHAHTHLCIIMCRKILLSFQGIAGYSDCIPVAVKTLTSQEPEVVQKFLEEAELMKKFSHPNIVAILGILYSCHLTCINNSSCYHTIIIMYSVWSGCVKAGGLILVLLLRCSQ